MNWRRIWNPPGALALVVAVAISVAAVGCADEHTHHEACPEPAGDPVIGAFTLDAETVAAGESVHATLELENFPMEEMEGMEGTHDDDEEPEHEESECPTGHVHVYLDSLTGNPLVMAAGKSFDVVIPADTPAGAHKLIARLQNGDHTIVEPQVTAEVTLTVTDP